jgi:diguanylate cyclase (GGDEF)-like protein
MLDIDHFKKVNDTFGHDHGDIVLRKIAEILNISLRTSDIPCRYGGEEFIVILPETDSEKAFKLAERIRKKIENTIIIINGNKINTSVSIGLSELKKNEKFDELIKRADIALYNAKNNGRNQTKIAD